MAALLRAGTRAHDTTLAFLERLAMHTTVRLCHFATTIEPSLLDLLVRIDFPERRRTTLEKSR